MSTALISTPDNMRSRRSRSTRSPSGYFSGQGSTSSATCMPSTSASRYRSASILTSPTQAGWGIIFHPDTAPDVRAALAPLVAHRRKQIGDLVKELDYLTHEQTRDWYRRHGVSPGGVDPAIVPYYLLLVGGPELIPFEFQYLLGVDYAVGRLAFDTAGEYDHYARSIIAYETAGAVPNCTRDRLLGHAPPERQRDQSERHAADRSACQRPCGWGPA